MQRRRRGRRNRRGRAPEVPPLPHVQPSRPVGSPAAAAHPPRMSTEPDVDGFREVHSRRRWRRTTAPRRPVPASLVGKCFNCLIESHVKAQCTFPSRCFRCHEEGHHERHCPSRGSRIGKRGRSPGLGLGRQHGGRRRISRRTSPADTVSARSASTGRSPSLPPVCEPPTPEPAAAPMLVDGVPDLGRERQSWPVPDIAAGHPSDAGHQGRVVGKGQR